MATLLVSATLFEVETIANKFPALDVLITGVGSTPTCYHLVEKLNSNEYDLLIQAGIAGSLDPRVEPGHVVMVQQDCFGDLGMEERDVFVPVFNTPFAQPDNFPFENGWLINNHHIQGTEDLQKVKAVTINKISDSLIQKEQLINHFSASVETMEGAAFHYVALQKHIPFVQLRGVSNWVGERNKEAWKIEEALASLALKVSEVIEKNSAAKEQII